MKTLLFVSIFTIALYAQNPVVLKPWMQVEGNTNMQRLGFEEDHLGKEDDNKIINYSEANEMKRNFYLRNYEDTIPVKSLKPGNKFLYWTVGHVHGGNDWNYNYTTEVMNDTFIFNDKIFYKVIKYFWQFSDTIQFIYYDMGENLVCDFSWNAGDTIHIGNYTYSIEEKGIDTIFNEMQPYMKLIRVRYSPDYEYYERTIFKKFGIVEEYYTVFFAWHSHTLLGAEIDGVTYGNPPADASEDNMTIQSLDLYQNFPNPFNPITTIKYKLNTSFYVTLEVFNLLGETIKTLEAIEKQAGEYKIQFDGSNLPNGVYFYKLTLSDLHGNKQTQTKQMILLK